MADKCPATRANPLRRLRLSVLPVQMRDIQLTLPHHHGLIRQAKQPNVLVTALRTRNDVVTAARSVECTLDARETLLSRRGSDPNLAVPEGLGAFLPEFDLIPFCTGSQWIAVDLIEQGSVRRTVIRLNPLGLLAPIV